MKFSICYINRDDSTLEKFLVKSLSKLKTDISYEVVFLENKKNENSPASLYNKFISLCDSEYLILTHEDMIFPPSILDSIQRTIDSLNNDFGVLGFIGRNSFSEYVFSSKDKIFQVDTLDPCFIVIKNDKSFLFDEKEFDEFHLYVEDFCARKLEAGFLNYTVLENTLHLEIGVDLEDPYLFSKYYLDYIVHIATTINKEFTCWGNYHYYKNKFVLRHPSIKTT